MNAQNRRQTTLQSSSYQVMKRLVQWMDTYYLDPLIGLIPGVGDLATSVLAVPMIYISAFKVRSLPLTLAVIFNTLADILLGMLPFGVGAVLDFVNRSFRKNCRMIIRYVENDPITVNEVRRKAVWTGIAILALCVLIYLMALWISQLTYWFFEQFL